MSESTYTFEYTADGAVGAVYEYEHGFRELKRIDWNEAYVLQADGSVKKYEQKHSGAEVSVYADVSGDGLFQKVAETWESNIPTTALSSANQAAVSTDLESSLSGRNSVYRFQFDDSGGVTAVYENEYGVFKQEFIEWNQTYERLADGTVLKTELEGYGTEMTLYADVNGDGWFEKASKNWAAENAGYTLSRLQQLSQRVVFEGQAVAYDTEGNAGQAYRLYKAAFNREADPDGLGYWMHQLDTSTLDLQGAARAFMGSKEFHTLYGPGVDDGEFVDLLYRNALKREADAEGKAYWIHGLSHGLSREDALIGFSESDENQEHLAELIAAGINYTPVVL